MMKNNRNRTSKMERINKAKKEKSGRPSGSGPGPMKLLSMIGDGNEIFIGEARARKKLKKGELF